MQCWVEYQLAMNETMAMQASLLNHLLDEMDWMVGLPVKSPRIQLPQRAIINAPVDMSTTNNIRVGSGSQVGQINAGAIVFLDRCVTTLNGRQESKQLAKALQEFAQRVVDSQELSADSQRQTLDLLKFLMEQAFSKERNKSLIRAAIQGIGTLVSAAGVIVPHWNQLKSILERIIG